MSEILSCNFIILEINAKRKAGKNVPKGRDTLKTVIDGENGFKKLSMLGIYVRSKCTANAENIKLNKAIFLSICA